MSSDEIDRQRQEAADRRQEVNRGDQARRIYESPLFKEAVDAIKDRLWLQFSKSALADDKARLIARLKLDCLDELLKDLNRHMDTGKLASQQLPMIERALEAMRRKRKRI